MGQRQGDSVVGDVKGGGGIGDVGWALEADIGQQHQETQTSQTGIIDGRGAGAAAEENNTSDMDVPGLGTNVATIPMSTINRSDANHDVSPIKSELIPHSQAQPLPQQAEIRARATAPTPKILRLVLLPSSASSTSPSRAKQKGRVAILDSRPSGYLIGRDRSLGSAVLRIKEMGVSRVHARVWRGFKQEGNDEEGEEVRKGGTGRETGWWVVDCGKFFFVNYSIYSSFD